MGNRPGNAAGSRAVMICVLLSILLIVAFGMAVSSSGRLQSFVMPSAVLAASFATLAYLVRGVSRSGAAAGALIALVITDAGRIQMFVVLVAVFALTWVATRLGRKRKQRLRVAERPGGRDGAQVLANLWVPAMAIALSLLLPWHHALRVAALAALAEAASDTISSEIGEGFGRHAWLITTRREVPVGTDGAVSPIGMVAGLMAAALIAFASLLMVSLSDAFIITLCGFVGMICDSFLGALFERRGSITNNVVNFLSTCVAAGLGFLIVRIW